MWFQVTNNNKMYIADSIYHGIAKLTHLSKENEYQEECVQQQDAVWLNGGSVQHDCLQPIEGVAVEHRLDHGQALPHSLPVQHASGHKAQE